MYSKSFFKGTVKRSVITRCSAYRAPRRRRQAPSIALGRRRAVTIGYYGNLCCRFTHFHFAFTDDTTTALTQVSYILLSNTGRKFFDRVSPTVALSAP